MDFGEKLQNLRKEKGMSQEDLATKLNVSRQAVSKWESGNTYPETDKMILICKLFDTSMDELMGLKKTRVKNRNYIKEMIDFFVDSLKMLYSMTFKQKIKFILEMGFYAIIIVLIITCFHLLVENIIQNFLYMINSPIYEFIVNIIYGILYAIYFYLGIMILLKLFKIRYFDYYKDYSQNVIEIKENNNKEMPKVRTEEKIIIRDINPENNPLKIIKTAVMVLFKSILLFITFGLLLLFLILVALLIINFSVIDCGLIFIYTSLIILSGIIVTYVIIEMLIKYIFYLKQNKKRLFILFIIGFLLCGISCGLFAIEFSTYNIIYQSDYSKLAYDTTIEMQENTIINYINHSNTDLIYEDRDDIYVEFYEDAKSYNHVEPVKYEEEVNNSRFLSHDYEIISDYDDIRKYFKDIITDMKDKKITVADNSYVLNIKVHISEENYNKINNNIKKLNDLYYE